MIFGHQNYLSHLLGFSNTTADKEFKLEDQDFYKKYDDFKYLKEINKTKCMIYFLGLPIIILIISNIIMAGEQTSLIIVLLAGILIDILLVFISKKYETTFFRLRLFRYMRFFLFYLILILNWILAKNPINRVTLRYVYWAGLYINFLQNYFLDFNNYLFLMIMILNSLVLILQQYLRELDHLYFVPEVVFNIVFYFAFNLMKKLEVQCEKVSFLESYRNENYIIYIQNLVNELNTLLISIENEKIIYINDFAYNYFINYRHLRNPTINRIHTEEYVNSEQDNNKLNENKDKKCKINDHVNKFLDSLLINYSSEFDYYKGESFKEIINKFSSQNNSNTFSFFKLGYFKHSELKDLYFEIHARRLKYQKEAIELLIYDISEIKNAEKQGIESRYKHKILAKIAHEFKTPLITIISIIDRILKSNQPLDNNNETKRKLDNISNLSNYTLSLISDIIHYASDYINLRINKNEVKINEVMDFSNNVLKTLVECNENKLNNIKTKLNVDKKLDSIKLFTDENRLKQILLNFISNAFKFTQHGYIKLKAKYVNESNHVELSVKDTGIGIKREDHDLIFKENVKLNIDNEYNTQGSGLGLSIVKNLADKLNYKVGFKSAYNVGSKFYILISCNNSFDKSKFKTISYQEMNISINNTKRAEVNSRYSLKDNSKLDTNSNNSFSLKDMSESKLLLERRGVVKSKFKNDRRLNENDTNRTKKTTFKGFYIEDSPENIELKIDYNITSFNFFVGRKAFIANDRIKLLIVDDHKMVREFTINILRCLLSEFNSSLYDIVECSDGIEMLNIIRLDTDNLIKLILIDENMEYLNGSESVKIIRRLQENRKIKQYHIVSITAFDDEESKKRIMESGVNSIINKPCNKSDLSKLLNCIFIPHIGR